MSNGNGALAKAGDEVLLQRIADGERPAWIAEDLGVTRSAIYMRYPADSPLSKEFHKAKVSGATVRLDKAERDIETAPDQLSVSRARELFRAVAWRAEREHPDLWGAKGINVNIATQNMVLAPDTVRGAADLLKLIRGSQ